jgi:Gpi18-like mannosyltransferase
VAAALALQRRSLLAGPLLMTAALVKPFAIVLAPVLIAAALHDRWPLRRIAATLAWALILAVLLIAPFWANGQMLDNLRYSLERSQIYNSASPYSLVREFLRDRDASEAVIEWVRRGGLALFGLLTLAISWRVWKGRAVEPALADVMFLFMLLVSLLYPWYLIPLIALLALRPDRPALTYIFVGTTLGLLYHSLTLWAWFRGGFSAMQIHLIEAIALTLPVLALLAVELVRAGLDYRRRAAAQRELSVS